MDFNYILDEYGKIITDLFKLNEEEEFAKAE